MPQISQNSMREYETIFVLKPEIEDEAAVAFIQKMMALVDKQGGKHLQLNNWGRKKLAWERNRHQKGMFVHHRYLGGPTLVKEYERTLGIDENVILRQTVLLHKSMNAADAQVGADVLEPPITKEAKREERFGRDRDESRDDDEDDNRDMDADND